MTRRPTPAVFFGHGSPMNAIEDNRYTRVWRRFGERAGRPRAILAVSAHWYGAGVKVTAMPTPRTIHDFGGFPDALFEMNYAAPGDPALAQRVRTLLAPMDIALDAAWGLDHGSWSVLVHAYPDADVPVVQLSLDATQPAPWHYELGRRLAPLRDEGVLVLGSGNIVHNLRRVEWRPDAPVFPWAARFDARVRQHIVDGAHPRLLADLDDDDARLSVPTPEHFLPLLYVLAVQRPGDVVTFPTEGIELGSIGMRSVALGLEDEVPLA